MSLRKCLLFAMLCTTVALAASGIARVYRANFDRTRPNTWLSASMPVTAARGWCDSRRANQPSRWGESFSGKSGTAPALLVPAQFKNPDTLGVGKLLVARRGLGDPDFAETVVLLVHYDATSVLGLILNRRTDLPLSRVLGLKTAKDRSDPVYLGGPVGTSDVFALFQTSVKIEKAEQVFGGVYLISDKSLFEKVLAGRPDPGVFHVYVGYAGWTREQLRSEVRSGAWFVFPADAGTVFNPHPESMWLQMIQKTELHLAKTEPFTAVFRPEETF